MRESAIQNKWKCQELFWSGVYKIYGVEMQKNELKCSQMLVEKIQILYYILDHPCALQG